MGSRTARAPTLILAWRGATIPAYATPGDPHVPQPETQPAELHPSTRRARRMAGARRRAQASRDRRSAERAELQAAAAEAEALRDRLAVDGSLVDALVERHRQLRDETGERAPALPLADVIRLARHMLGSDVSEAEAAIRERLGAALGRPPPPPRLMLRRRNPP